MAGFSADDCTPVRGDSLAHAVSWKQPLASLRGKPARLEFSLRDGRLYAIDVVNA